MRPHGTRLCVFILAPVIALSSGCAELFGIFGPGGAFGPAQSAVGGDPSTQTTTIPAPSFLASQLDPELEATAGAKVIVVADMDGDGLDDFVSGSNESQPIQLHMRTGAGVEFNTFSIAGGGPIAQMVGLEVADFDADGNPDIAVLVNDTGFVPVAGAGIRGAVVLLFAPADPTDTLAWTEVTINQTFLLPGEGSGMTDFGVADMNGDNRLDIVLATNEVGPTDLIRLYFNPGAANVRNPNGWTESTAPVETDVNTVTAIEIADLDGDGDNDVVAAFPTAKTFNVRWMINPQVETSAAAAAAGAWTRGFVGQQGEVDPANQGGDEMAVGDIDLDGDIDVAIAHKGLGLVQWFENPGTALLAQVTYPWSVYNLGQLTSGVEINQLQLVDLNLDGQLDAYVTASGNMVGLQPAADVHDFWQGFSILSTDPVADIGHTAFSDVNGDGLLDIIAPLDRTGLAQDQFLIFTRLTP